jgi:PAS domain S-box-containing protein
MKKANWSEAQYLRELAEAAVRRIPRRRFNGLEHARLEHELEVHATELEMQNEALREAHRELEASRAEYLDLFEHAPMAYLTMDRSGLINAANVAASDLLGIDPETLVGTRLSKFITDDQAEAFERYRREVLGSGDRFRAQFVLTTREAAVRNVQFESQCTNPVLGEWRAALVDVTHTSELERQVEQAEHLAILGTQASGIVHDFKNILSSIVTAAELASRKLEPDHPAWRTLERLKQTALRGGRVVTQLLAFTRDPGIETGFVDLSTFIPSLEPVLRAQLGSTIVLRLDLGAADALVGADGGQIEQILLNLTTNARHAMPSGGTVSIVTANEELGPDDAARPSELAAGRYVVMSVVDTGTGMDERTAARAFEPFFTTKPAGRGSGLGLPMVQAVAHRAGGYARLESEPGRGTTVTIYLPCASEFHRTPTERPLERAPLPADLLVVLVADDQRGRQAARDYFRSAGCGALDAANGFEALSILKENRDHDIVLLADIELPNLARIEFARAARAIVPTLRIAVTPLGGLAWTSSARPEDDPEAESRLSALHDVVARSLGSVGSGPSPS